MAKYKIKAVKPKLKNGIVKCKLAISHGMITYNQAKKKGVEANFITHITGTVNGETVIDISTSQFFSKNPVLKFSFKGDEFKAGDKLMIVAVDTKGDTFKKSGKIK